MLVNELILIFRPLIMNRLALKGYNNIKVKQDYPPIKQGVDTNPTIYFHHLFDKIVGYPKRAVIKQGNEYVTENLEYIETSFQIDALVPGLIVKSGAYTAKDLINIVRFALYDSIGVQAFKNAGVGVYRPTDVRNDIFQNDHDDFSYNASCDFTLQHTNAVILPADTLTCINDGIYPI